MQAATSRKHFELIDPWLGLISEFREESFMEVGPGGRFIEHEGQLHRFP